MMLTCVPGGLVICKCTTATRADGLPGSTIYDDKTGQYTRTLQEIKKFFSDAQLAITHSPNKIVGESLEITFKDWKSLVTETELFVIVQRQPINLIVSKKWKKWAECQIERRSIWHLEKIKKIFSNLSVSYLSKN